MRSSFCSGRGAKRCLSPPPLPDLSLASLHCGEQSHGASAADLDWVSSGLPPRPPALGSQLRVLGLFVLEGGFNHQGLMSDSWSGRKGLMISLSLVCPCPHQVFLDRA